MLQETCQEPVQCNESVYKINPGLGKLMTILAKKSGVIIINFIVDVGAGFKNFAETNLHHFPQNKY